MRTLVAWMSAALAALAVLTVPVAPAAVCGSSNGCEFWDESYHETIVYRVDTVNVDVLVVPAASPFLLRDSTTARLAVQAWDSGANALGQSWFANGLTIRTYVLGVDTAIPDDALTDPEIIVVMSEHNPVLLFGIGLQLPLRSPCVGGSMMVSEPWVHEHEGSQVITADCDQGGTTCVALNTNFLLGGRSVMYDVIAHEVGHCLGIGHVGDALDFDAKRVPAWDIMSYQFRTSAVNCVSNLNIRAMEGVFAQLLGQPSSAWLAPGQFYHMSPSQYSQVSCATPPPGNVLGG